MIPHYPLIRKAIMRKLTTFVLVAFGIGLGKLEQPVEQRVLPLSVVPGKLVVMESKKDDQFSLNVYHEVAGRLYATFNAKNEPQKFFVELNGVEYYDLNGDGMIDFRYDNKRSKSHIWMDERWVEVRHLKGDRFGAIKSSLDLQYDFQFADGAWRKSKP